MAWTYSDYVWMTVALELALLFVTFVVVLVTLLHTDLKSYVSESFFGFDLAVFEQTDSRDDQTPSTDHENFEKTISVFNIQMSKKKWSQHSSRGFIVLCAWVISLMPVLIFNGCF